MPLSACYRALQLLALMLAMMAPASALAQPAERWYQVEMTVFLHEYSTRNEENWRAEPALFSVAANARTLSSLMDVFNLEDWDVALEFVPGQRRGEGAEMAQISSFRLPDPARDPMTVLLPGEQNFRESNRALSNAPAYRVLFHDAWRQPVRQANRSTPVRISGGQQFADAESLISELEGSITIRFNRNEDRVVLDSALWLNEINFNDGLATVQRRIPVNNSREMRSNEFHYIDHPVVGILVQVFPYTVPVAEEPF